MKKLILALSAAVFVVGCQNQGSDTTTETSTPSTSTTTTGATTPPEGAAEQTVAFADIQPILKEKCVGCHGTDSPKEGISLVSHESIMKGGEHGPIITAGDPENSLLIHALRGSHGRKQMPPKMDPLPEEQIAKIEAWIKGGAKS
ncbi:MAG TPA: c-type cytochrome domain-containing protein [Fimbriimonadaceae bacterium]|nr:c-type cytochrome domain-containing protein [Fimbriimonadaceae bacterium]